MPQTPYSAKGWMANVQAYPWANKVIQRRVVLLAYVLRDHADWTIGDGILRL